MDILAILKQIEWNGDYDRYGPCPFCGSSPKDVRKHDEKCDLNRAIQRLEWEQGQGKTTGNTQVTEGQGPEGTK
jgi:hypothetical protein